MPDTDKIKQLKEVCNSYEKHLIKAIKRQLKKTSKILYSYYIDPVSSSTSTKRINADQNFDSFIKNYKDDEFSKNPFTKHVYSKNMDLLVIKLRILRDMKEDLNRNKINDFQESFKRYRDLIEQSRSAKYDPKGKNFIQKIVSLTKAKIASIIFRIWNTRGAKVAKKIVKITKNMSSDSATNSIKKSNSR